VGTRERDQLTDQEFLAYLLTAVGLVAMAGLMSGLTLGLMSLDDVDLEVLRRSGNSRQRACADRIAPVMANPHRLLVTLLVCNAAAAEVGPAAAAAAAAQQQSWQRRPCHRAMRCTSLALCQRGRRCALSCALGP
jgi:CBS domain containing-hemolysin-like protein